MQDCNHKCVCDVQKSLDTALARLTEMSGHISKLSRRVLELEEAHIFANNVQLNTPDSVDRHSRNGYHVLREPPHPESPHKRLMERSPTEYSRHQKPRLGTHSSTYRIVTNSELPAMSPIKSRFRDGMEGVRSPIPRLEQERSGERNDNTRDSIHVRDPVQTRPQYYSFPRMFRSSPQEHHLVPQPMNATTASNWGSKFNAYAGTRQTNGLNISLEGSGNQQGGPDGIHNMQHHRNKEPSPKSNQSQARQPFLVQDTSLQGLARQIPLQVQACMSCKTTETQCWRKSWNDQKLCNACGLRLRQAGAYCPTCCNIPSKVVVKNTSSSCRCGGQLLRYSSGKTSSNASNAPVGS